MKPTSLKHEKARESSIPASARQDSAVKLEARIEGILTDLARVLVASGYGISGMSRLTKRAFFEAALELDTEAGRRKNNARIAAITGLTRAEVSQLARNDGDRRRTTAANRAERVSLGWVSDSRYCDKHGNPNVLPFSGRDVSFQSLVRDYSGDIPARAMLTEMLRLRMARKEGGNGVKLVRTGSVIPRHAKATLRAISPWVRFLSRTEPDDLAGLQANSVQTALAFDSLPQLFAAVRELQSRATAFVKSINELSAPGGAKVSKSHTLHISFALATRVEQPGKILKGRGSVRRLSDEGSPR